MINKIPLLSTDELRWYTLVPKVVQRLYNTTGKRTGYTPSKLFEIYKRKGTEPTEYYNTIQEEKKDLEKFSDEIETRENKKRNTKFEIQENDYCWFTQKHKKMERTFKILSSIYRSVKGCKQKIRCINKN
jgi:hypothetical protein